MHHFVYACKGREGGHVPKYTVVYSQQGKGQKLSAFVINE